MKLRHHLVLGCVIVVICAALPPTVAHFGAGGGGQKREFIIKARRYAYDPGRITVNRGDEVHIRLVSLDVVHGFFLEGHDIMALIEPGTPIEADDDKGDNAEKPGTPPKKAWPKFKLNHPSQGKDYSLVDEIVFTADRPGKYRYRCSHTCGTLHPFMQGEMIVGPNYPYLAGMGGTGGMILAAFAILFLQARARKPVQGTEAPLSPEA
jgi:plastocyanin